MSTTHYVFRRRLQEITLHEHSSRHDLCINDEPVVSDMTAEEMMKLAYRLMCCVSYSDGTAVVTKHLRTLTDGYVPFDGQLYWPTDDR